MRNSQKRNNRIIFLYGRIMHFLHISLFLISLILGVDLDGIDINCISSRDDGSGIFKKWFHCSIFVNFHCIFRNIFNRYNRLIMKKYKRIFKLIWNDFMPINHLSTAIFVMIIFFELVSFTNSSTNSSTGSQRIHTMKIRMQKLLYILGGRTS